MRGLDADRWMRWALALPGVVVDLLDRLQPVRANRQPPSLPELHALVKAHARHPEAYLALEPGLHHVVQGAGVQAYEVRGATAFCIGGLNVAPPSRAAYLQGLWSALRSRGLRRMLLFPVRSDELPDLPVAGLSPVQVGVEAWLDLPGLAFRGNRFQGPRNMRNRARRRGLRAETVAPEAHRDELDAIHSAWLSSKRPRWRMKLLVGSPGLDRPFDRRYYVARSDHRIEAFVTVLPGAPGTFGVDVMCRRPDAPAGAMELLLMHIAEDLRDAGARALSLGPCPMAGIPTGTGRPLLERVFHLLYSSWLGNRVFGFRNLHRFKKKFRPRWEPVFFAAGPRLGMLELYLGCRMWGLY